MAGQILLKTQAIQLLPIRRYSQHHPQRQQPSNHKPTHQPQQRFAATAELTAHKCVLAQKQLIFCVIAQTPKWMVIATAFLAKYNGVTADTTRPCRREFILDCTNATCTHCTNQYLNQQRV